MGDNFCRGNPPLVAPTDWGRHGALPLQIGGGTGALPLQIGAEWLYQFRIPRVSNRGRCQWYSCIMLVMGRRDWTAKVRGEVCPRLR
jgi:hypothetical protein